MGGSRPRATPRPQPLSPGARLTSPHELGPAVHTSSAKHQVFLGGTWGGHHRKAPRVTRSASTGPAAKGHDAALQRARSLHEAHVLLHLPIPPHWPAAGGVGHWCAKGRHFPRSHTLLWTLSSDPKLAQSLHLQTRSFGPHSRKAQDGKVWYNFQHVKARNGCTCTERCEPGAFLPHGEWHWSVPTDEGLPASQRPGISVPTRTSLPQRPHHRLPCAPEQTCGAYSVSGPRHVSQSSEKLPVGSALG